MIRRRRRPICIRPTTILIRGTPQMENPTYAQSGWQLFAFGSAFFAALTAIFGKLGVEEINSNFAVLIRTIVVVAMTAMIVAYRKEFEQLGQVSQYGLMM